MTEMLEKRKDKDIEWCEGRDLSLWNALLKPLDIAFKIRSFHSLVMSYAVSLFQGKLLSTFDGSNTGIGVISGLSNMGKELCVADLSNHCIQIFDSTGQFQRADSTGYLEPANICGTKDGSYYLLLRQTDAMTSDVYLMQDKILTQFPHVLNVQPSGTGLLCDDNYLYIGNWIGDIVYMVTLDGHYVREFGSRTRNGEGYLNQPFGLCFHGNEYLCVSESQNDRISVFNRHTGEFVKHIQLERGMAPRYLISIGDQLLVNIFGTNVMRIIDFDDGSCRRQFKLPANQKKEDDFLAGFSGIALVDNIVFISDSANRIYRYE
jgi:hypothetical protein